jgi:hypothetical protein
MKKRFLSPLLIPVLLIVLVGLACSSTPATSTQEPASPPPTVQQSTQPPVATALELPTAVPTEVPTEAPTEVPAYFTEDFNGDIPNWSYFTMHGDKKLMDLGTHNGSLVFNLTGQDLYAYLTYDPWSYDNVRIDVSADNRGMNDNSVCLICRYSAEEGWYEFNIGNDGLWQVFVYDIATGAHYQMLNSGGSTAINTGKAVNEYTAICDGTTLSLYINGVKATSFDEHIYALRKGLVGIGVSAYKVLPVIVQFDKVSISKP